MTDTSIQQLNSVVPSVGWTPEKRSINYKYSSSPVLGPPSGNGQTAAATGDATKDAMSALIKMIRTGRGILMSTSAYRHPELSIVSLARPILADGITLPSGSRGTVVHVYYGEKAYIVEFERPVHAVVTVEADSVEE